MVLTTTLLSMTRGRRPARWAETAAARPHGPPPTITRSASFSIALGVLGDDRGTDRDRALYADDLVAARSDADVGDLCLDEGLDAIEVAPRLRRQVGQSPCGSRAGPPPLEPLVARDGPLQQVEIARELLVELTVRLIAGAEPDSLESVEHVQLRDCQIREAIHARGIAHDDAVEPSAAARTTRGRAELVSELSHSRRQRLIEFGRQRSVADACRIGLHHADHRIELAGRDAYSCRGAARCRAARGDERIRAVIDVEQRALRSLE